MDLALAFGVGFPFDRDFDTLLSALALAVSVGALVPIFIIKEDRRKELTIAIVVTLLIALTATMVVRNREHAREVHEIQNEIVGTLSGNRWTSDQLYKQLHFPRRTLSSKRCSARWNNAVSSRQSSRSGLTTVCRLPLRFD